MKVDVPLLVAFAFTVLLFFIWFWLFISPGSPLFVALEDYSKLVLPSSLHNSLFPAHVILT